MVRRLDGLSRDPALFNAGAALGLMADGGSRTTDGDIFNFWVWDFLNHRVASKSILRLIERFEYKVT